MPGIPIAIPICGGGQARPEKCSTKEHQEREEYKMRADAAATTKYEENAFTEKLGMTRKNRMSGSVFFREIPCASVAKEFLCGPRRKSRIVVRNFTE
jgi:hypothetical protein